jgi:hypothetical protein
MTPVGKSCIFDRDEPDAVFAGYRISGCYLVQKLYF